MKRFTLIAACCLFANSLLTAQEFPDFGIINNEERDLKQCTFDKDANAVVLLHEAFSDYDAQHQLITVHHIKIKILKEKGIESANVSIPFYRSNDFEQITMVEGMTINMVDNNPVQTKLDRKSIYTKKTNERWGEMVFAFPAIKAGSIIEYKYRSSMKHYGGLKDWDFQEELPVMMSRYTLVILPNAEFAYRVNKTLDIPITVKTQSFNGGVYFEMKNVPGLGNEPYMDARKDYLQKVIFQLSGLGMGGSNKKKYTTSWEEVTRELMMEENFGAQLNKNIGGTDDFIKQIKTLALPEEKMKGVFNYVRNNMVWNNMYSMYTTRGVKDAWQTKSGNSGEINLLLINLLKEAGLETYPMLVSERFNGKVNKSYPFMDQFNSVFACVIISNKKYYLDATDKNIPAHITPSTILNTTAFVVNRKAGGLINITNDTLQYKENIIADITVTGDGTVSGEVSIKSIDYARVKKLEDYKEDKTKFLARSFIVDGTAISAKDIEISNVENDSLALEQQGKISGRLNTTGDYTFLPLNLFTGFDFNPFLSNNRLSNINFGYRRSIILNVTIQLPPDYVVDEMPKSIKLSDPDKDILFMRHITHDKEINLIRCMMQFEFKKSLYETDMYPIVKEVYQRIFEYLKEPVLLKKK